jgi:DNA-binding transcriptional MerR regulator
VNRAPAVELSSREVAAAAAITFRQVDYWVRVGILRTLHPVEGSGSRRTFAPVELHVARVVARLSDLGIEGDIVRHVAAMVRRGAPEARWGGWVVTYDAARGIVLRSPLAGTNGNPGR